MNGQQIINSLQEGIIYTFTGGKVKLLLKTEFFTDQSYVFYKRGKGLVMYRLEQGHEIYHYYKMSGGKYKLVASRLRRSNGTGSTSTFSWSYYNVYNGSYSSISKATFNKRVKSIKKGTKIKLAPSWKWASTTG